MRGRNFSDTAPNGAGWAVIQVMMILLQAIYILAAIWVGIHHSGLDKLSSAGSKPGYREETGFRLSPESRTLQLNSLSKIGDIPRVKTKAPQTSGQLAILCISKIQAFQDITSNPVVCTIHAVLLKVAESPNFFVNRTAAFVRLFSL